MSMHEDFTAPLETRRELTPAEIDFHIANAHRLRSQEMHAQALWLWRHLTRPFRRPRQATAAPLAPGRP